MLRTRGQYEEAERLYRESLDVFEKLGDSHSVAVTQSSLADLLRTRGQYEEAERLYRLSLAVFERFSPDHPNTAQSLNNLGGLLRAMGDLAGARPYYERALAIFEKTLGSNHPITMQSRAKLANLEAKSQPGFEEKDFIGGDYVAGDKVSGDKVIGYNISMGNISSSKGVTVESETTTNVEQPISPRRLRDLLLTHFDIAELNELCFELGVEFEDIPGSTLSDKSSELILYCERHDRTQELIEVCKKNRPMVKWE
ncbi:MAG: tetratricopeptide repeat-containing protein [Gammaproteobacteria bacterium]|nr:MAG: tetratricopeptide repeat-containing protein [Gammaproteobacteria bacterium]